MTAARKTPERSARPDRQAAPPLPDFDALDKTHREVLLVLDELGTLIEVLDRDGVDARARELAQHICEFFAGQSRQHHADEEQAVFPGLLERKDAELTQLVLRLQQDHGWLEEDWLELEPQLQAVARGYNWYDLDMLRIALPVFAKLNREHIALEESIIYPAAKQAAASKKT